MDCGGKDESEDKKKKTTTVAPEPEDFDDEKESVDDILKKIKDAGQLKHFSNTLYNVMPAVTLTRSGMTLHGGGVSRHCGLLP